MFSHDNHFSVGNSFIGICIQRSKIVPVGHNEPLKPYECYSTQRRKLDEYLSWQHEQQEKRQRLGRYLKVKKLNDEADNIQTVEEYQGNINYYNEEYVDLYYLKIKHLQNLWFYNILRYCFM